MSLDRYCRLDRDCILVEIEGEDEAREVAFSRCDTHEKILAWAEYFAANTRIGPAVLSSFIKLACATNKLPLRLP